MIVTKNNFKPFKGTVSDPKYIDKLELTGFISRNDKIAQMLLAGEIRLLQEDKKNIEFIDEQKTLLKSRNIEDDVIINHIKELAQLHKERFEKPITDVNDIRSVATDSSQIVDQSDDK